MKQLVGTKVRKATPSSFFFFFPPFLASFNFLEALSLSLSPPFSSSVFRWIYENSAAGAVTTSTSIDSTYVKAQRSAFGGKGGQKRKVSAPRGAARRAKFSSLPT